MPRYRLNIEYDGQEFVGWQRQDSGLGVQQVLEDAARAFAGEAVTVQGAGRTDSGVHALGQVAHVDFAKDWPADTVKDALNAHVRPHAVSVLDAEPVDDEFHARFSATYRRYRYRVLVRRAPPAVAAGRVWWVPVPLDEVAMDAAGRVLLGNHDFTTFRASLCQAKSPVKTLDELTVRRDGDEIQFDLGARSFLHHQVRNIVGTLRLVGEGKWSADDLAEALAAKDRSAGGPTAPAHGLYLTGVSYD